MSLEYRSSYFIVIPTGNNKKKNRKWAKCDGNSSPFFYPFSPFPPVSILTVIIVSIRSEEVLLLLYAHLQHHNDTIIKTHAGITDAKIKTQEDFFNKIFTFHFIARVRKDCVGFYCERELETEHNWNILTPKLWSATLCLSRSPLDPNSIRAPESPFGRVWLSLPHLVSNWHSNSTVLFCSIRQPYITFKLPCGDMDTPPRLRNFFRYLAIGMCHFRFGMPCVIVIERK